MNDSRQKSHIVVIGAGFTGLTAAYEISRQGIPVTLLEKDDQLGGLAKSFNIEDQLLDQFYHHWFNSDEHIIQLVKDLGLEDQLEYNPTMTGIYMNEQFHRLSTPLDVLRFKPLSFLNRIRLGLLVLRVHCVKDWRSLESMTAEQWLLKLCGKQVYEVIWRPLLRGKFGPFASEISAVWFWNKLMLRGGSRDKLGRETLVYYHGSFAAFAEKIARKIEENGGSVKTSTPAEKLIVQDGRIKGVQTPDGIIDTQTVIATCALPIIADLLEGNAPTQYLDELRKIEYLANVCLVLELRQSLSDIYWLNVNDPEFPFIGVIEHTNFQSTETCGDRHIIYLSQYLPETDKLYQMDNEQVFEFALSHIKRMFPKFDRSWVIRSHIWKARYAQPIVVRHYSKLIPEKQSPVKGLYIESMAQIYPEDRGTNYAVRQGQKIGKIVAKNIAKYPYR